MFAMTFLPDGVMVSTQAGDTLLDIALDNGIALEHECGGNCACTTCHVWIETGMENLSPMQEVEAERLLDAENRHPSSRLACQAIVQNGNVTARLP